MKYSNTLTSHHPERNSHRVDKMSGSDKEFKKITRGKSKKFIKKFTSKKRRVILRNHTDKY